MGSKMLKEYFPPYDCTVYEKLKASGAVLIGKTNCDEFAMGSGTIYSAFGETINWWGNNKGQPCVPGGSSGGSAVSVAAMSCYLFVVIDSVYLYE
jgi:aspartyl-tRNA(Asn)/glutamyl-tRNA(Gln) amidotransferase subunit A